MFKKLLYYLIVLSIAPLMTQAEEMTAPAVSADSELSHMTIASVLELSEVEAAEPESKANWPARSWEMPALKIEGRKNSELREEERIGSYNQPRWTAHRRFAASRIYVRPEGEIDTEFWFIGKIPKRGHAKYFTQTEVEIGLPYRFQFDFYAITRHEEGGETYYDYSTELRYALADWGEIWGNPTLYLEYKFQEEASDVIEAKILLGDELAPRWHWGTNLIWEQELTEGKETVLEMTNGLSYTVLDEKLSVGIETKSEIACEHDNRSHWSENIRVGPSIQWRPTKNMHIDIAPLFGVTHDSRRADVFVVLGYEF